jgi:hypothetical protein
VLSLQLLSVSKKINSIQATIQKVDQNGKLFEKSETKSFPKYITQ